MVFNTVYTVKKEISKDAFLRQLLFNLASDNGTPPDVVNAKFRPVEEDVEEVIVCTAHIEMDYSASIGYDREGTHWTPDEQIKSKNLGEREQSIEATTEWTTYRGHASGEITATALNGSKMSHSDHNMIESVIKSIQSHSIDVQGEADVNDEGRENVLRECRILFKNNIRFPGDLQKNIRTNSDITVLDFCCYKLPIYTVEFTYNEKTYFAWGYACGSLNVYCKGYPCMADMDETQIEKKTRKYRMVSKATRLLFVGSLFFACIMCFVHTPWWLVMPIASLAMAIFSHRKYKDEYDRVWLSCFSIERRQDALEEAFKARSFDMLTEEERKLFWIKYHTHYAMGEESNQER